MNARYIDSMKQMLDRTRRTAGRVRLIHRRFSFARAEVSTRACSTELTSLRFRRRRMTGAYVSFRNGSAMTDARPH